MYRRDRKKGGGGLIGYFHSNLPSKELKMTKVYKTLEILAIDVRIGSKDILLMRMYRPPKQHGCQPDLHYLRRVKEELNDICMWASLKYQTFILTGNLNLDRMKPERGEGRILTYLEEVHGMECMITRPSRVTPVSGPLMDVILTNKPDILKASGSFYPKISDHHLGYGISAHSVPQQKRKIITFESLKNVDLDQLNGDLEVSDL